LIAVVSLLSEHENGPLIRAVVPLGSDAVPETDVIVMKRKTHPIAATQSNAMPIAAMPRAEVRFALDFILSLP